MRGKRKWGERGSNESKGSCGEEITWKVKKVGHSTKGGSSFSSVQREFGGNWHCQQYGCRARCIHWPLLEHNKVWLIEIRRKRLQVLSSSSASTGGMCRKVSRDKRNWRGKRRWSKEGKSQQMRRRDKTFALSNPGHHNEKISSLSQIDILIEVPPKDSCLWESYVSNRSQSGYTGKLIKRRPWRC